MTVLATLDQSAIRLRKKREMVNDRSLYGTPITGSSPRVLNFVDESLKGSPEFRRSGIGKPSQLPGPRRRVHQGSAGSITLELIPGAQTDEFIEEGMNEEFSSALGISATTISAAASDNSLNGSGGSEFANVEPGQWIQLDGMSTAANNTDGASGRPYGAMVLSKPSDAKIILAYHTLTDESAGATVTVEGEYCRNGTKPISSTYERDQSDATTDRYQHYPGVMVTGIDFQFTFNEICRMVCNLTGMSPRGFIDPASETGSGKANTSIWNGQSDVTETFTRKVTDMSNNVRAFRDGGALSGNIKAFNVSHELNVEPIQAGMTLDPQGQSLGTKGLSGALSGFLIDADGRVAKAWGSTPTDFHIMVIPDAGVFGAGVPIYVLTVFEAVFSEMGDSTKTANTGPSMLDLTWEGNESATYADAWFQVTKLPTA